MTERNAIAEKSKAFALRIIRLYRVLHQNHEFVLSKQMLRSGTSIGANVKEALRGQSRADFYAKLNIALKEASETHYWLRLMYRTEYISKTQFSSLETDILEILSLLTAICRTANKNK